MPYGWENLSYQGSSGYEVIEFDMSQLNNGNKFPIIYSLSCSTGTFQQEDDCMGELLLNSPDRGAVAFFGASKPVLLTGDGDNLLVYSKYLFTSIFEDFEYIVGNIINKGINQTDGSYPELNLFGDPALDLSGSKGYPNCTKPDLAISHLNITTSPKNPTTGDENVNIHATVHNIGGDTAENVNVRFIIIDQYSGDEYIIDGQDQLILEIQPGDHIELIQSWDVSDEFGDKYLIVQIDPEGSEYNVDESFELNNQAGIEITSLAKLSKFEWVPVDASGPHTIDGNEIILEGGSQQVTLELRMSSWDWNQDDDPLLNGYQVTIDPAGYDNGIGGPLNPLGRPDSPEDGAFIDANHQDFVFSDFTRVEVIVDTATLDYEWNATISDGGKSDNGRTYYGGTLILDVPIDTSDTYTIGFVEDTSLTFMNDDDGEPIGEIIFTPAKVTIEEHDLPYPVYPDTRVPKNRYISFKPGFNGGKQQAFRIKIKACPLFLESVNQTYWVQGPLDVHDTTYLGCTPDYRVWPDTLMHVGDQQIIPGTTYTVEATSDGEVFSSPVDIDTWWKWGDIVGGKQGGEWMPPDGVVGLSDIMACISYFQGQSDAPLLTWCDIDGENGKSNRVINVGDIMQIIAGFQGSGYPAIYGAPEPCPP